MGERKVINKYYPPSFDASTIPQRRRKTRQQINVRMMLPMTVRCKTCGTYMYQGTKFNTRKEDVIGDMYLGVVKKFRFYFKCIHCKAELVIRTDPQNHDYAIEQGATRNFEAWRDDEEEQSLDRSKRNGVKCLESRMLESKQEADIMATVEELRSMKARRGRISVDAMLAAMKHTSEAEGETMNYYDEEDEALVKSLFHVRRIDDEDDDEGNIQSVKRRKYSQEEGSKPPRVEFKVIRKPATNCLESLCSYVSDNDDE